jgi:glycosyltransferase involved in cell wall biosynthesis
VAGITRAILIDVTRSLGRSLKGRLPTGIDRVDLAYIKHFAPRAQALIRLRDRPWVLSRARSAELFANVLHWHGRIHRPCLRTLLRGLTSAAAARPPAPSLYLNIGHSGLDQPHAIERLARGGASPLFMVHDIIPITHHEFCRPGEVERHKVRMRTLLRLGCAIVANSQATLDGLVRFACDERIAVPPAQVALLGPGTGRHIPGPRPLPAKYFVFIGTIEPRKNLAFLLTLWRRLVEQQGPSAPHLALIGQRGWECESVVDLLERCAPIQGFVHELGQLNDAEAATWLHHAQALLYPSYAEGFGLPLVEAMRAGVPAIASRLPVFRELAGDIPDYLDPLDGLGWLQRIDEYNRTPSLARTRQLERLRGYTPPSWGAHFEAVEAFLQRCRAAA